MKLSIAALAALLALPVAAQMAPAPSPDARAELQAATPAKADPQAPIRLRPCRHGHAGRGALDR